MFTLDFDLSATRQSCVASVGGELDSERGLPCLTVIDPQSWWAVASSWLMVGLPIPPCICSSGKLARDRGALSFPSSTSKLLLLMVGRHSTDLDFNFSFQVLSEQLPHFRMRWFLIFLAAAGEIWYTESSKVLGLYSPPKDCGNWFCQKREGGRILMITCYESHMHVCTCVHNITHIYIHTYRRLCTCVSQRHTLHYNECLPNHVRRIALPTLNGGMLVFMWQLVALLTTLAIVEIILTKLTVNNNEVIATGCMRIQ